MDDITRRTIEIVRGHAYSKNLLMKDILEKADVSRAALTKIRKAEGSFTIDTCERLLNACGYTLKIVHK